MGQYSRRIQFYLRQVCLARVCAGSRAPSGADPPDTFRRCAEAPDHSR
jgi:hypothetical protein